MATSDPQEHLRQKRESAQTQLQLLDRAYNDARYNAEFTVSAGEAKAILKKVVKLQGLLEGYFKQ